MCESFANLVTMMELLLMLQYQIHIYHDSTHARNGQKNHCVGSWKLLSVFSQNSMWCAVCWMVIDAGNVQVLHSRDSRHCGCRKCFRQFLLTSWLATAVVSFLLWVLLLNATSKFKHSYQSHSGSFEVSRVERWKCINCCIVFLCKIFSIQIAVFEVQGGPKNRTVFLKVCNSRICWRRIAFYIPNCSVFYME